MIEPIRNIFLAPELKRRVLREGTAHRQEGAVFAAALLEACLCRARQTGVEPR